MISSKTTCTREYSIAAYVTHTYLKDFQQDAKIIIKIIPHRLSTVAEETIRAYFETRLALLEPVFPLACHRLCEGPDFSLEFNYKPPQHTPGEGEIQYFVA